MLRKKLISRWKDIVWNMETMGNKMNKTTIMSKHKLLKTVNKG